MTWHCSILPCIALRLKGEFRWWVGGVVCKVIFVSNPTYIELFWVVGCVVVLTIWFERRLQIYIHKSAFHPSVCGHFLKISRSVSPINKSDPKSSKSDQNQTKFSIKIRPKSDQNSIKIGPFQLKFLCFHNYYFQASHKSRKYDLTISLMSKLSKWANNKVWTRIRNNQFFRGECLSCCRDVSPSVCLLLLSSSVCLSCFSSVLSSWFYRGCRRL